MKIKKKNSQKKINHELIIQNELCVGVCVCMVVFQEQNSFSFKKRQKREIKLAGIIRLKVFFLLHFLCLEKFLCFFFLK